MGSSKKEALPVGVRKPCECIGPVLTHKAVSGPQSTGQDHVDVFFMRPGFGEIQWNLSADKEFGVHRLRNVLGFGKMTAAIFEGRKTA